MRKYDPVEIVAIFVPVLAQAVVAAFAFGVAALWIVILSGRLPELPI
jgi:hypothetical protein